MLARYSSPLISEPLIPSQQCSFSGRRTVFMFQVNIALMLLGPVDPSNVVPPAVGGEHMYSDPARLTPSRRTVAPVVSTSLLPWTCSALAAGSPKNGSSIGTPPVLPLPPVPVVPAARPAVLIPLRAPDQGHQRRQQRGQHQATSTTSDNHAISLASDVLRTQDAQDTGSAGRR